MTMIRLHTLGPVDLRDSEGREIASVLAQPKRLALLAYLALAGPGRLRRRDILVSMFWPEQDDDRARGALRQALRFLRTELGRETLVSRGDEEVGVDPAGLQCDAAEFDAACDRKAWVEALALYTGTLMEGFFVAEASPEFERWLEDERGRIRRRAVQAAWALADAAERAGDRAAAVPLARRAAALSPDDEAGVRRLLRILDSRGDRAGALAVYEEFRRRLAAVYGATPAPETEAVIAAIRSREEKIWESPLQGWAPEPEGPPSGPR
jgi:DNA-binding SARP family transcriptional activator